MQNKLHKRACNCLSHHYDSCTRGYYRRSKRGPSGPPADVLTTRPICSLEFSQCKMTINSFMNVETHSADETTVARNENAWFFSVKNNCKHNHACLIANLLCYDQGGFSLIIKIIVTPLRNCRGVVFSLQSVCMHTRMHLYDVPRHPFLLPNKMNLFCCIQPQTTGGSLQFEAILRRLHLDLSFMFYPIDRDGSWLDSLIQWFSN